MQPSTPGVVASPAMHWDPATRSSSTPASRFQSQRCHCFWPCVQALARPLATLALLVAFVAVVVRRKRAHQYAKIEASLHAMWQEKGDRVSSGKLPNVRTTRAVAQRWR